MKKTLLTGLIISLLLSCTSIAEKKGKHLFILSGQSNMQGHKPAEAFTPTIEKEFGKENVIILQDAQGGQPILRWYKDWKDPLGKNKDKTGDLYQRLITKVNSAIKGQKIQSVTFLWMQGERDAKMKWADAYEASIKGVIKQITDDLKQKEINFVLGRISDYDMKNKKYPHWTKIRDILVKVATDNPRGEWVDTDDLNDGLNRRGKKIKNDLHYSAEGYKIFGTRMAEKSIKLIKANK
jgi:hypothetical protein